MAGPRRLARAAAAAAVVSSVALAPSAAVAPAGNSDNPSLKGLVLSGGCPGQTGDLKNALVSPQTRFLFAPLRIMGPDFVKTGKWLFPYTVEVMGEGLKTRHMTPGVVYTRPGRAPRNEITCVFDGATKEDGPFQVLITGSVLGR